MRVMIREGSVRRDLEAVLDVRHQDVSLRRAALASDGIWPPDLLARGYMDGIVQRAIDLGLPPVTAYQMASLNPAEHFGLDRELGGIAPGRWADFLVLPDLRDGAPGGGRRARAGRRPRGALPRRRAPTCPCPRASTRARGRGRSTRLSLRLAAPGVARPRAGDPDRRGHRDGGGGGDACRSRDGAVLADPAVGPPAGGGLRPAKRGPPRSRGRPGVRAPRGSRRLDAVVRHGRPGPRRRLARGAGGRRSAGRGPRRRIRRRGRPRRRARGAAPPARGHRRRRLRCRRWPTASRR